MKPLSLEIQAFGPFVEKQTINFDKLSQNGIFLIKGKTGSGKTTIFDAMTFALFGGGSGTDEKSKIGRNDFEEWRCNQAPDNLETFVSFEFESHKRKYRFTRKLTPKRKNLSAEYEAGEIIDNKGNINPFFNNPKANDLKDKAEEIIGLTKEQFRQVVLLPQGQFERFLTASSDEKTEILNKIFNTDIWKRYADKFFESADKKKKELEELKNKIDLSLNEEDVENIEELKNKVNEIEKNLNECINNHKKFDSEKKQKELNDDIALAEEFKQLHNLEKESKDLKERKEEIDLKITQHENAEKAEKVRPLIKSYNEQEISYKDRKNELDDKVKLVKKTEENHEQAKKELENHESKSPINSLNNEIGKLESKRENYKSLETINKDYADAKTDYETEKNSFVKVNEEFEDLKGIAKDLLEKSNKVEEQAKEYRNRYYSGIYGEIADSLKDNEKCPVCGSTNHPSPAKKEPNSVSKADLDEMEARFEEAKKAWSDSESKRTNKEKEHEEKVKLLNDKETNFNKLKERLSTTKSSLIKDIDNIEMLEHEINSLKKQAEDYTETGKTLKQKFDDAKQADSDLKTQIKTAEKEVKEASKLLETSKNNLQKELEKAGYSDVESVKDLLLEADERSELLKEITSYKTMCDENKKNLSKMQAKLNGKKEPDASEFKERQEVISNESKNHNEIVGALKKDIERLNKKHTDLSEIQKKYDKQFKTVDDDWGFAKKLRGDSGIGIQRYVLAIMFNQVIGEANQMLKKIHGGRYTLFRSDDKGKGNKRGLELKVHDNRSPEKDGRSVSMLSGGEKFLVSLALSIGMSTVAQKSGVQIEALFIDEGFGTLDQNSISDAMDVLDGVRKSNSMIGIISHVELLEENIPTQLEVIKTESGNKIKTV